MLFLDRVQVLIADHGITENKLLVSTGLDKNSLYVWKKRGTIPSGDTIAKIADYFNVTTDYLLGRTDDPRPAGQGGGTALTGAQQQLLECYTRASPDDKEAVDAVLRKYRSEQAPIALVAARGGGVMEIPAKIADAVTAEMVPSDDDSL